MKVINAKVGFIVIFEIFLVFFLFKVFVFKEEYAGYSGVVSDVKCESYSKSRSFLTLQTDGGEFFVTVLDSECEEMKSYYKARSVDFYYSKKTGYIVEMKYKGINRFSKKKMFYVSLGFCFLVFLLANALLVSARRALTRLGFNI